MDTGNLSPLTRCNEGSSLPTRDGFLINFSASRDNQAGPSLRVKVIVTVEGISPPSPCSYSDSFIAYQNNHTNDVTGEFSKFHTVRV